MALTSTAAGMQSLWLAHEYPQGTSGDLPIRHVAGTPIALMRLTSGRVVACWWLGSVQGSAQQPECPAAIPVAAIQGCEHHNQDDGDLDADDDHPEDGLD